MRIQIVQRPTQPSIDGIRLDSFEPGKRYEVGHSLAAYMFALGWAVPVKMDEAPSVTPPDIVNPRESTPNRRRDDPPNLSRDKYTRTDEIPAVAADWDRRRTRR